MSWRWADAHHLQVQGLVLQYCGVLGFCNGEEELERRRVEEETRLAELVGPSALTFEIPKSREICDVAAGDERIARMYYPYTNLLLPPGYVSPDGSIR